MTGPTKNRNKNKFYEFYEDKGHSTDECIHLRRQIEEAVKSGQLSHLVKEIKQGGRRGEQAKAAKKGETPNKEKATAIFRVQPCESRGTSHPPHVCGRGIGLRSAVRTPLQQITPGRDGKHSTIALMNFIVVRSLSSYNGIIGHPGLRKIQAVPSTDHGMLKFLVEEEILTIRSNTIIPAECRMVAEAPSEPPPQEPTVAEGIKVVIHPKYQEQTVTIGGSLSEKGRMELCNLLKDNLDIFA
ncbi:hypothetical protein Tco_0666020 [Tanacetum coccineum]